MNLCCWTAVGDADEDEDGDCCCAGWELLCEIGAEDWGWEQWLKSIWVIEHVDEEQLTDKKADEKHEASDMIIKIMSIMRSNLKQGCWGRRLMVTQDDAGEDEEDEYIVSNSYFILRKK
jgi:hypothetical protein